MTEPSEPKKKTRSSRWTRIPVMSNLHGEANIVKEAKFQGGKFGSIQDDQEEIQLLIDKNQRASDKKLRSLKYFNASINNALNVAFNSEGSQTEKVLHFIPVHTKAIIQSDLSVKSSDLSSKMSSTATVVGTSIILEAIGDTAEVSNCFSARGLFLLSLTFLGLFYSIPSYGKQLAQLYCRSDHHPHTASAVSQLASTHSRNSDFSIQTDSDIGMKWDKDQIRPEVVEEMMISMGCSDAMFPSADTYAVTKNLFKNKKCTTLLSSEKISKEDTKAANASEVTRQDVDGRDVENNYYNNFLLSNSSANGEVFHDENVVSAVIMEPTEGPTTSTRLALKFSGTLVQNNLNLRPENSYSIRNSSVFSLKVFLDIRMNGILLRFPGGNLIEFKLNNNSEPINISCNLAEHGLVPGVSALTVRAIFTVEKSSISYVVPEANVLFYLI